MELSKNGKVGSYGEILKRVGGIPSYEGSEDVSDEAYEDGRTVQVAKELMSELRDSKKPFFLAVGLKKPHLPFVAPKRYWDMYQREQFKLPSMQEKPQDAPAFAMQDSWELKYGSYITEKNGDQFDVEYQRTLIHGYHACVSYVDQLIGGLLEELNRLELRENAIVVLWGDHGFHLGDHGMWCKHTNYEQATRSPFIIVDPRLTSSSTKSDLPVELIDLFPTLCEQAGLEVPEVLDGKSLVPVLKGAKRHKTVAVSQFPRYHKTHEIMGYAFRDERYRYVEWVDNHFFEDATASGNVVAIELYDYELDPEERVNVAKDPNYAKELSRMKTLAHDTGVSRSLPGVE